MQLFDRDKPFIDDCRNDTTSDLDKEKIKEYYEKIKSLPGITIQERRMVIPQELFHQRHDIIKGPGLFLDECMESLFIRANYSYHGQGD